MRSLSTTLLAAQKSKSYKPLRKVVLSRTNQTTKGYEVSRILSINHSEQPDSYKADIILYNDGSLTTLDFENYQVVISYGARTGITRTAWAAGTVYALDDIRRPVTANGYQYRCAVAGTSHATNQPTWPTALGVRVTDNSVTWEMDGNSGDEYSRVAPLKVRVQELHSGRGILKCILRAVGIPDQMKEDKALSEYTQTSSDNNTVKTLISAITGSEPDATELTEEQLTGTSYIALKDTTFEGEAYQIRAAGQILTIPNRTITKLAFKLKKTGSPSGTNVTFRIRATDDEEILASKTFPISSIGTSPSMCEVTLTTPITVDEEVWIYVEHTSGDASNYISVAYNPTDVKGDENFILVQAVTPAIVEFDYLDCVYSYKYSYAFATLAPYTTYTAITVVYDSEDSLIDTFKPADYFSVSLNENRWDKIEELLGYTRCKQRIGNDGKLHIFVPVITGKTWVAATAYILQDYTQPTTPNNNFTYRCTTAGTSHATTEPTWPTTAGGTVTDGNVIWTAVGFDYEYKFNVPGDHTFLNKTVRLRFVEPNRERVRSHPDHHPQYSGDATSATSYALDPKTHTTSRRLASNAQATAIASAIIERYELDAEKGFATVPMNVGQELWDYEKVTDSRQGDIRIGNIQYLARDVKIPEGNEALTFSMALSFGKVTLQSLMANLISAGGDTGEAAARLSNEQILEMFDSMWDEIVESRKSLNTLIASHNLLRDYVLTGVFPKGHFTEQLIIPVFPQ